MEKPNTGVLISRPLDMNSRIAIAGLFLLLSILACGGSAAKTADDYFNEYGGNRDVYARILSLDDCTALQVEFDQASENNLSETPGSPAFKWTTGYMVTADTRMKELGCYE